MGIRYEQRGVADNAITLAKMAANSVDSDQYVDGSLDTAHIADNQVTLAKMAGGTDGNIISFDASGDPVAIATGNDGQVLTSAGAGAPPAFEDAAAGAVTREGGQLTEATTTSTSAVDLIAATSLTLAGIAPAIVYFVGRKSSGAADDVITGLKLNSTITGEAATSAFAGWKSSTTNRAEDGAGTFWLGSRLASYTNGSQGRYLACTAAGVAVAGNVMSNLQETATFPTAEITSLIIRGISDNSSNTLGVDELHVYSYATS